MDLNGRQTPRPKANNSKYLGYRCFTVGFMVSVQNYLEKEKNSKTEQIETSLCSFLSQKEET